MCRRLWCSRWQQVPQALSLLGGQAAWILCMLFVTSRRLRMSFLRNITSGLRSLFQKKQVDRDLNEELSAYQEMAAEEKIKDGLSRTGDLRAVRLERGSLELTKGGRPFRRLGIVCGDVLAGLTLWHPHVAQVARVYWYCCSDFDLPHRRQHRHLQLDQCAVVSQRAGT